MLNRKPSKSVNGVDTHNRNGQRPPAGEERRPRRRFIISSKAAGRVDSRGQQVRNGVGKPPLPAGKGPIPTPGQAPKATPAAPADLAETIKTLLHLAHENGHITYDDINDVLPEGLSPQDLDELYTKLGGVDGEIVDHAEVERAKPAEPEEEEDSRLEVLDDPVRMYMNQMGKVPLLTREQEVEICKRIEEAESEMKQLRYCLGFTAKEHIAIAEKLVSHAPKERFDRVLVDKKVANREGHLRELRQ